MIHICALLINFQLPQGLPYVALHDNNTNADAIVAWNETSKEAMFLWKFTNETRDWVTDAVAYKTDDFVGQLKEEFPFASPVTELIKDPQVHAGFYAQFESLAVTGTGATNMTQALYSLNGGQHPLFVAISGFSLGGALSELSAVWASYKWPYAHVYVATQGAPKVGNEDYVTLFRSTVGMVWRYVFNLDEVPATPPLAGYRTTRNPIWITSEGGGPYVVLMSPRPDTGTKVTTWYDHWCEVFYVPILKNATAVSIPQWVNAGGGAPSG